jgi:uncharacterized protein (UPF0335 family)
VLCWAWSASCGCSRAAARRCCPACSDEGRHERPAHHPRPLPDEHRAADERLEHEIERIERLEEEKRGLSEDIRDVYNDMRAAGYDTKCVRQIVRLRRMKPEDRRQMEAILDVYKNALGID